MRCCPAGNIEDRECCGRWTPDGKFYIFLNFLTPYRGDKVWALDERRGLFRHPSAEPVQLTDRPDQLAGSHSRQGHEQNLFQWQNPSRRALSF